MWAFHIYNSLVIMSNTEPVCCFKCCKHLDVKTTFIA